MNKEEIIKGLMSLIVDRESLIDEEDAHCIFKYDKKVLEEAIRIIKEAPEVPVQEPIYEIIKFKKYQLILFLIQTLIITIFSIMLIKEKKYVSELFKQLDMFKNLLNNF